MDIRTFAKLAAFGACAVIVGLLAVFAGFWHLFISHHNGLDSTNSALSRAAVGGLVALVIVVHAIYARVLWEVAKGKDFGIAGVLKGRS